MGQCATAGQNVLLALLFAESARDMYIPARIRIDSSVVHACCRRQRGGGEYLHLLWTEVELLFREPLQFAHIGFGASRMRCYEVVCKELLFAGLAACGVKLALELQQILDPRFAHAFKNVGYYMFRRKLELSGDVVLRNRGYVLVAARTVCRDKIGTDSTRNEHMFDALNSAQLPQKFELWTVVGFERRTSARE